MLFTGLLNNSANMSLSSEELLSMLDEKIKFGMGLGDKLQNILDVDGMMKLQRKIRQEIQFLKRVRQRWCSLSQITNYVGLYIQHRTCLG